jgi:hypothetical protein
MTCSHETEVAYYITGWDQAVRSRFLAAAPLAISPTASLAQAAARVEQPVRPDYKAACETVRLNLAGNIDQWYVRQDQGGVVFIMNLTDPKRLTRFMPCDDAAAPYRRVGIAGRNRHLGSASTTLHAAGMASRPWRSPTCRH